MEDDTVTDATERPMDMDLEALVMGGSKAVTMREIINRLFERINLAQGYLNKKDYSNAFDCMTAARSYSVSLALVLNDGRDVKVK